MNINAYLNRIGYIGQLKPDVSCLRQLLRAQVYNVPFENADIFFRSQYIRLELPWIYHKIVEQNRGGYCYEINSLFAWLLTTIGFNVKMVSARVARHQHFTAEYDHMALVVTVEGADWLVDAGFGNFACEPLLIAAGNTIEDETGKYQLSRVAFEGRLCWEVAQWNNNKRVFYPEYIFTNAPQQLVDFAARNFFQQISPESHFLQNFMCSKLTMQGRISVVNNFFSRTLQTGKVTTAIEDHTARLKLLSEKFNLSLPELESSLRVEIDR